MNFSRTFLVAALLSCHLVTHAQELSLRLHNVSVKQAMTELEHKSGYSFVYEGSDVNTSEVVTVNASTLTEAVSQILAGQRLHFEIKGKKVIISRADRQKTVGKGDRRRITGLITDEQGEPIIGATVKEQGTGNGTISDLEGRFSLEADSEGVLQVSYVGFATQELPVSGRRDFRITLREDNKVLSEVVVIGYGTQRKGDVTSSVGSVKSEDFITGAVNDAGQLIQGKIAIDPTKEPQKEMPIVLSVMSSPISGLSVSAAYAHNGLLFTENKDLKVPADHVLGFAVNADFAALFGLDFQLGLAAYDNVGLKDGGNVNTFAAAVYGGVDLVDAFFELRMNNELVKNGTSTFGMKSQVNLNLVENLGLDVYFNIANFAETADTYAVGGDVSYTISGVEFAGNLEYAAGDGFSITPKVIIAF